jgi:phospholipid transport system transporter-binding protein
METAGPLLRELRQRIAAKADSIDFSAIDSVDSTILAVILACLREARRQGVALRISGLPPRIRTLADLYGVAPFVPV